MGTTAKIVKYGVADAFRSRWLLVYSALLFAITYGLFRFTGETSKALLGLTNFTLTVVPLVSLLFGAIELYGSAAFTRLLLAQPVARVELFRGLFWGSALPLAASYLLGIGLPLLAYGGGDAAFLGPILMLLALGVCLTVIFTALAFMLVMAYDDKAKGIGLGVVLWLFLAVVYDGAVLLLAVIFQEYPLERPLLLATLLNPIDLGRILMLLSLDVSALMGYTGAIFQKTLGSFGGRALSAGVLAAWFVVGYGSSRRMFLRRDF